MLLMYSSFVCFEASVVPEEAGVLEVSTMK